MIQQNVVDHLFRHQHGKMVAILTRIFGFEHLEMIEDAVQDTFITAMKAWNKAMPENPEAWLTQAAKNRALDLLRKLNAEQERLPKIESGPSSIAIQELFLEGEIADSQLRMI
ncbi:MAG: RNA polymerase sigma factor, partial [Bacteroidia bacterium]